MKQISENKLLETAFDAGYYAVSARILAQQGKDKQARRRKKCCDNLRRVIDRHMKILGKENFNGTKT